MVWKQISPEKAFSGAPWRQCSNLLPCAGDGRLRRDVASCSFHCYPLHARSGILHLLPGTLVFSEGVSLCLALEPRTALLIPHQALSQLALPFQVSTRVLVLYTASNWAQPVITYFIPFVTAGSICSIERLLQLPTLPPIASLCKLHFDPRYSWQLVALPTSALMFRD